MLDPNITKWVYCTVSDDCRLARYKDDVLRVNLHFKTRSGKRRLWLKYSIIFDEYYLTDLNF